MKKKILFLSFILVAVVSVISFGQDKRTVSMEKLVENLDEAMGISEEAMELRNQLPEGLPPSDFVKGISTLQRRCEPIIVLIAETNPPGEIQRFAMHIAMGIKGVELGLWYYMYGILANQGDYINYGDTILSQGIRELNAAEAILEGDE